MEEEKGKECRTREMGRKEGGKGGRHKGGGGHSEEENKGGRCLEKA